MSGDWLSRNIKCEYWGMSQCCLYFLQYFAGFFHDCCKVVISQNNYFRGTVKAVTPVQYCTANSQGYSTHFWEGFHVSYSFNMLLNALMNICVPCIWMFFSWMRSFENELGTSSLCPCHNFPQCLPSSGADTAIITSSWGCSKYLQIFLCSSIKIFPISVHCKK